MTGRRKAAFFRSVSSLKKKIKEKEQQRGGEVRDERENKEETVITYNMLPRTNSDYMKCLAHIHDFGMTAPKRPRKDESKEQRESSDIP